MNRDSHYQIRTGAKSGFFTLWLLRYEYKNQYEGHVWKGYYERKLTTKLETSIAKLKELGINEYEVMEAETVPFGREYGKVITMPNGQHMGKEPLSLPIDYLAWWLQKYQQSPSYKKVVDLIREPVLDSGLLVEGEDGLLITKKAFDAMQRVKEREEKNKLSQHVGTVGEKITLDVLVAGIADFDTFFGLSYLIIMNDTNGNQIVHKTQRSKFLDAVDKGWSGTITGTVKGHGEYEGVKQTSLRNVKIVKSWKHQ